jgi:sodium transport system permease protein
MRMILHVFCKDGLEILRDRRTLFVNVVLPALLYPFIVLFMIQVVQLTQAQRLEPPRVGLVDLPTRFVELATALKQRPAGEDDQPALPVAAGRRAVPERPRVSVAKLSSRVTGELRSRALELAALQRRVDRHEQREELAERERRVRGDLLTLMRANDLTGLLVVVPRDDEGPARWFGTYDNAHVHGDQARSAIEEASSAYRRELVVARLADAGLGESALRPLTVTGTDLATPVESVRTRLAGIIPLLLVVLAALGAFYPAIDLIAGERERGTLESLLSWPVTRRDIFLGKLLVTCSAAAVSVVLNLLSLGVTTALAGGQLAGAGADLDGAFSAGLGSLALCFVTLLPLTLTLGALSLALAGLAASVKEAQNYLSPLLLVVMVAALVAAVPDTRPSLALDLIPITGSVLALKESLQGHSLPWLHLLLSTATSTVVALVVVGWATRLLENERFCYPGLVRAGWGRFRRWGARPEVPEALEVMAVYAVAVAGMTLGAGFLQKLGAPMLVAGPLLLFILAPTLIHCWLGAYRPATVLSLRRPSLLDLARGAAAIPFALLTSVAIASLQPSAPAENGTGADQLLKELHDHGLLVELLIAALVPAICEELLCRGTLLTGLRRSLGDSGGVLLSAFLFATLHLSPYRFLPQFTLGVVLAILTIRSRSILPAMVVHAGHNSGAVLLGRIGDEETLAWLPPLAALGIGVLGLWAIVCLRPLRRQPAAGMPVEA